MGQFWNPIEEAITLVHEVGHSLGAIHSDDKTSVMFPTSGTLAYGFDEINRAIIEATKTNFFNPDKKQKVRTYFTVLKDLRKSHNGNNILILEAAKGALSDLLQSGSFNGENSKRLSSLLISVSPDSAFAFALKGYIDFKSNRLKEAKVNFLKAIELDPEFAEVKKYLAFTPETIQTDELPKKDEKEAKATPKSSSAAKKK